MEGTLHDAFKQFRTAGPASGADGMAAAAPTTVPAAEALAGAAAPAATAAPAAADAQPATERPPAAAPEVSSNTLVLISVKKTKFDVTLAPDLLALLVAHAPTECAAVVADLHAAAEKLHAARGVAEANARAARAGLAQGGGGGSQLPVRNGAGGVAQRMATRGNMVGLPNLHVLPPTTEGGSPLGRFVGVVPKLLQRWH